MNTIFLIKISKLFVFFILSLCWSSVLMAAQNTQYEVPSGSVLFSGGGGYSSGGVFTLEDIVGIPVATGNFAAFSNGTIAEGLAESPSVVRGVTINGGDDISELVNVKLDFFATDSTYDIVSVNISSSSSDTTSWLDFVTTNFGYGPSQNIIVSGYSWTMQAMDSAQSVYIKVRNSKGLISGLGQDSIRIDLSAPLAPQLSASGTITTSNILQRRIVVSANEDVKEVRFFENDELLVTVSIANLQYFPVTINLRPTSGAKVIKAVVVDVSGKLSPLSDPGLTFYIADDERHSDPNAGSAEDRVDVTIPIGAVSEEVQLVVSVNPNIAHEASPLPTNDAITGIKIVSNSLLKTFDVELIPSGDTSGAKITSFNNSYLDIVLNLAQPLTSTKNIRVFYYNPTANAWASDGISLISVQLDRVKFRTTHLSVFAIANIIFDELSPSILSIMLDGNKVVTGDFISVQPTVNIMATDNEGVSSYRVIVCDSNGIPVAGNDTLTQNFQSTTNAMLNIPIVSPLSSGKYIVKVIVGDQAGNFTLQEIRPFNVVSDQDLNMSEVLPAPNPFNPSIEDCHIGYQLNTVALVKLYIHAKNGDLLYQNEMSGKLGYNEFVWDGRYHYGKTALNGGYLGYVIAEAQGKTVKKLVKIAVLR